MDETAPGMMGPRGDKRQFQPQQQTTNEANKRRAPYAPRACDACRRRKGRCDGRKPCEHCVGRSLDCTYAPLSNPHGDERRSNTTATREGGGGGGGAGGGGGGASSLSTGNMNPQQAQLQLLQQLHQHCRDAGGSMSMPGNTLSSLGGLVLSLQDQLQTLASLVKEQHQTSDLTPNNGNATSGPVPQPNKSFQKDDPPQQPQTASWASSSTLDGAESVPAANSAAKRPTLPFYGPTSPEYSFNAARISMSRDKHEVSATSRQRRIPSLSEEDMSDDDDEHPSPSDGSSSGLTPVHLSRGLLQFSNLLSKKEASRFLGVYQEIIGSIHPICDVEGLSKQLDRWYGWTRVEVAVEADELLVLGLALATALSAESVSRSEMARELYEGFKDAAFAKLVDPVPTEKSVSITLMMGFYEYFNGRLQTAWRMCGLAGRMAMQLGMHSREVSQKMESEGRFAELATLTCSLVVLDRQWSAAAGLPPNFQLTDFDSAQPSAVKSLHLQSVFRWTRVKFNEPISRVARGERCDDDDVLEVTVFQIEQWRRRTLENQRFTHPLVWELAPATRPPSWMTMLYLRANAVRAILLRPFFLSSSGSMAGKKIRPALELITDSVNTLSILDRTTDTYRKQHPQFQHFLSSSCALLSLVIANAGQNRAANAQADLSHDHADMVRQNFRKSLALSAAYLGSSPASRRLWKRLMALREPLIQLDILPPDEDYSHEDSSTYSNMNMDNTTITTTNTTNISNNNNSNNAGINGANPAAAQRKTKSGHNTTSNAHPAAVSTVDIGGGTNNDYIAFQIMNGGGGNPYKPAATQINPGGNMLYAHHHDLTYSDPTASYRAPRDAEVQAPVGEGGVDSLELSGADFLGTGQGGFADYFAPDWPTCDGVAFFSEAGL